jgi:hypothetical protein
MTDNGIYVTYATQCFQSLTEALTWANKVEGLSC